MKRPLRNAGGPRGNADEHAFRPDAESAVNVRDLVTPRGVRFWLVEDYAVPIVSLDFAMRGGGSQDPAGKSGVATMMAGLLDEGAGDLDHQAFQRALDERAIEMSFHAERDHFGGRMRTLARELDRAGELLKLAVNQPRFDEAPFERVREQMNARLRHDITTPAPCRARPGARACSPATPMRCPRKARWNRWRPSSARICGLAKRLISRGALMIGLVGAINEARAMKLIDDVFADLPADALDSRSRRRGFAGLGTQEVIDLDVPNPPSASAAPRSRATTTIT